MITYTVWTNLDDTMLEPRHRTHHPDPIPFYIFKGPNGVRFLNPTGRGTWCQEPPGCDS